MSQVTAHYLYAGFWKRVAAAIVDNIILWVPGSLFRWLAADTVSSVQFQIIDFAQLTVIWSLYYGLTESSTHQGTIGKRALNLRVIDIDGQRLSFARAAGRFLAGFIAVLPLGLGILMISWTTRKQGLHDKITRCLVIRTPPSAGVAA